MCIIKYLHVVHRLATSARCIFLSKSPIYHYVLLVYVYAHCYRNFTTVWRHQSYLVRGLWTMDLTPCNNQEMGHGKFTANFLSCLRQKWWAVGNTKEHISCTCPTSCPERSNDDVVHPWGREGSSRTEVACLLSERNDAIGIDLWFWGGEERTCRY